MANRATHGYHATDDNESKRHAIDGHTESPKQTETKDEQRTSTWTIFQEVEYNFLKMVRLTLLGKKMMKRLMTYLVLLLCACGCDRTNDPLAGRSVSRVDVYDQKINRRTVITNITHIAEITNQIAELKHGWKKNRITLPSPYWSLTFSEGTNSVGTLFVGANWMSYGNLIRTSTPEENGNLWQAVSEEPAQHKPGTYFKKLNTTL